MNYSLSLWKHRVIYFFLSMQLCVVYHCYWSNIDIVSVVFCWELSVHSDSADRIAYRHDNDGHGNTFTQLSFYSTIHVMKRSFSYESCHSFKHLMCDSKQCDSKCDSKQFFLIVHKLMSIRVPVVLLSMDGQLGQSGQTTTLLVHFNDLDEINEFNEICVRLPAMFRTYMMMIESFIILLTKKRLHFCSSPCFCLKSHYIW